MTHKYRELIPGDRVRITGPWASKENGGDGGIEHIGKIANVIHISQDWDMPILIHIHGWLDTTANMHWSREHLRALPRRKG